MSCIVDQMDGYDRIGTTCMERSWEGSLSCIGGIFISGW